MRSRCGGKRFAFRSSSRRLSKFSRFFVRDRFRDLIAPNGDDFSREGKNSFRKLASRVRASRISGGTSNARLLSRGRGSKGAETGRPPACFILWFFETMYSRRPFLFARAKPPPIWAVCVHGAPIVCGRALHSLRCAQRATLSTRTLFYPRVKTGPPRPRGSARQGNFVPKFITRLATRWPGRTARPCTARALRRHF